MHFRFKPGIGFLFFLPVIWLVIGVMWGVPGDTPPTLPRLLAIDAYPSIGASKSSGCAIQLPAPEKHQLLDGIDSLLTRLALSHIPGQFTEEKQWGMQVEKRRGVQLLNQQGKLDVRSKKELVNHGNWRRYSASLRNPEEEFQIQLRNIQELPNGGIGFEVHCKGHLDFVAQQANWKNGIQLLNLTANGHTEVEVQIELEVQTEFIGKGFLPDVIIRPTARQARLLVNDFRIDRIGKIGGELAKQIGREARKQIKSKLPEHEQKIVDKINQEFAKKEGGYRFSFSDTHDSKLKDVFSKLLDSDRGTPAPGTK